MGIDNKDRQHNGAAVLLLFLAEPPALCVFCAIMPTGEGKEVILITSFPSPQGGRSAKAQAVKGTVEYRSDRRE